MCSLISIETIHTNTHAHTYTCVCARARTHSAHTLSRAHTHTLSRVCAGHTHTLSLSLTHSLTHSLALSLCHDDRRQGRWQEMRAKCSVKSASRRVILSICPAWTKRSVCVPCMYALYVCLIYMPSTAWTKRSVCVPCVYALYVCLIRHGRRGVCVCVCVPCMYAIHEVCVCALLSGCVQLCVCVQTAIGKLVIAYNHRQASSCEISHARPYMMTWCQMMTNDAFLTCDGCLTYRHL